MKKLTTTCLALVLLGGVIMCRRKELTMMRPVLNDRFVRSGGSVPSIAAQAVRNMHSTAKVTSGTLKVRAVRVGFG